MYGQETRVLLRHYLKQGWGKKALARRFGVSRRTIHHWIRTGQLDRDLDAEGVHYGPRPQVPTKLDPFRELIRARLEEFPDLTAVRLLEEIRADGYGGGYTQLKVYVRQIRPRPPEEPVVRFETAPGLQAQVDFAHFRFPWGVRYALLVVLGYSRLLWARFYRRQDMPTLMQGLEEAFRAFGGVPRELLFDQMRSVVLRDLRPEGGRLIDNAEFLRFSAHWGFRSRVCRPYRAKTKGKVERPIRYLRQSFVYGRSFVGDGDLNDQLLSWLDRTANVRVHGTTGARPVDRFEGERYDLLPLAHRPYRSLVLVSKPLPASPAAPMTAAPHIPVERRPLSTYAELAGSVR